MWLCILHVRTKANPTIRALGDSPIQLLAQLNSPALLKKHWGSNDNNENNLNSSHLVSCPIRLSCLRWISTNLFPLPPFLENNPPFFNNNPPLPRLTSTRPLCRGDLAKYIPRRWAPTSYKWSHNPYKWPCKGITGVATAMSGVIILLITGRGPTCKICYELIYRKLTNPTVGKGTSLSKSAGWYPGYVRSLKGHNFPNTIAQSRLLDGCQHILKYIPNLPTPFKQKGQGQR